MQTLSQQRCFHHGRREAVARCPECKRFFCRECITEHEDRVICATCLKKLVGETVSETGRGAKVKLLFLAAMGFFCLWMIFYSLGHVLLSLPSSFHDGSFVGDLGSHTED